MFEIYLTVHRHMTNKLNSHTSTLESHLLPISILNPLDFQLNSNILNTNSGPNKSKVITKPTRN